MPRKMVVLVGICAVLAVASTGLADGVILNGLAPRSIGRGGTNIAFADNGAVLFDNPAGAVNVQGQGLMDLGVDGVITQFRYSDPGNPSVSDTRIVPLPQIGYVRKSADERWAYGLGVFAPAGFSERFVMEGPPPLDGRGPTIRSGPWPRFCRERPTT